MTSRKSITLIGIAVVGSLAVVSCSKCSGGGEAASGITASSGGAEWKVGACLEDPQTTIFKIKEVKGNQYNVAQLIKGTGAEAGTMDVDQERFSAKNGFKEIKCPGAP